MADVITKFKLETTQYDSKLRDAAQKLKEFGKEADKAGADFAKLSQENIEAARSFGTIATSATNTKDKLKELVKAYNDVANAYNNLTQEQQQSDIGKAMAQSLDQLKGRIAEAKQEMQGLESSVESNKGKFGAFGDIINSLGNKMGLTGDLTAMLTSKTALLAGAVGASVAAIGAAAKKWAEYNDELAKSNQITTVTTGLSGPDAEDMTIGVKALVDTYDVDFREAINAANTLMTQFGVSGEKATDLIRAGLQGMIVGDGPKLLSMIQQYAPAFRDAGISASELVAVIQNSEGGLFTDENMNAIVMGIKNIRMMTDRTSDSLKQLGIDGSEMTRQLNEGTITIFQALQQVTRALENTSASSQTAGEVMQQVFGRQGTAAGMKLNEAISSLNLNLEETKSQTGEVGEGYDRLVDANRELEQAMRDCFGYNGWQTLANGIKTELVGALAFTIEWINEAKKALLDLWNTFDYAYRVQQSVGAIGKAAGNAANAVAGGTGSGGNVYTESVDERGNIVKATRNGVDVTDQVVGVTVYGRRGGRRGGGGGGRTGRIGRGGGGRGGGGKAHVVTPEEQAENTFKNAKEAYAKTIAEAQMRLEAGMDDHFDYDKKELQAQEKLTMAYANAYAIHNNEKYKTAFIEASQKYLELAEVVEEEKRLFSDKETPLADRDNPQTIAGSVREKMAAEKQAADVNALTNLIDVAVRNGLEGIDIDEATLMRKIFGEGADIPDEYWQSLAERINAGLASMGIEPITIDVNTGAVTKGVKQVEESWQDASKAIQAVGNAMQQIQDPTAKVMGIIGEAIANIALGFAQATAKSSGGGIFAWIAAIAGGIGTMISTINAIHSATGYAEGGVIPGNHYSGDMQWARVNAGEVILNRAQQGNIASQLQGGALSNIQIVGVLQGEDIVLSAKRVNRRKGNGEYVTSKAYAR